MVNIQLKIVEEGLKHPLNELTHFLTLQLLEDDILVRENADLDLKIKFTRDNEQDLILLQLRDTESKQKLGDKVLHYMEHTWLEDISAEAHSLIVRAAVTQH